MTPEHLHHDMAIAALKAGKHVYIEKPLAHTIEEGWDIVKAWETVRRRSCQVGTQNRSSSLYKKAKELIQQGMVGDVHFVRAFWYRNGLPNEPSWRYVIPAEATPQNTDWKRFLGTAPKRAWDPHRYFQWRLYWDYSGGISTDLLVHQTDIVNFMLDKTVPKSCMASGGVYRWTDQTDDRDVPDMPERRSTIIPTRCSSTTAATWATNSSATAKRSCGNEGTIRVMNRQDLYFEPETYNSRRAERAEPRARGHQGARRHPHQRTAGVQGRGRRHQPLPELHRAILGKEQPIAPPPVGQQAAISGHMATLSTRTRRRSSGTTAAQEDQLRLSAAASPWPPSPQRPPCPAGASTSRWIVGRGVDLTLVIGSAAAGYLYLLLFAALHVQMSWLWWFW